MSAARLSLGLAGVLLAACALGPVQDVAPPVPAAPAPLAAPLASPPAAPRGPALAQAPGTTAPALPRAAPPAKLVEVYPARGGALDLGAATGVHPPEPAVGEITLNFENADIRSVVEAVLHDLLNLNYVIEPDVRGAVTVRTGRPLSRAALLPTLEAILEANGVALIRTGDIYRVVVAAAAAARAGAPRLGRLGSSAADGFSLRIFPLEFVGAAEMEKILAPLLPEGRIVRADQARNLMVIGGTSGELRRAEQTIAIFDVDQLAGMSVLLESLDNVDVSTLVFELDNIFGGTKNGPLAGIVGFIPIERLNAILVIAKQARYLDDARNWIARLDRTRNAAEKRLFVYYVQNGKAADLAQSLRGIFPPGGTGPGVTGVSSSPGAAGRVPAGAPPLVGATTADRALASAPADAAAAAVAPAAGQSAGIRIIADEVNNALLIQATTREYELIQEALAKLDLVPLQVLIEASILEVTLRDVLRFGVQYALRTGGLDLGEGGSTILSNTASSIVTSTLPGFSFSITGDSSPKFIIDALTSVSEVNVLSAPQIFVLDNHTAKLQVGDQVPITRQTSTSTISGTAAIVNSVEYRDTGVTLEVLPRVNASGLVILEITQEVSDVVVTTTSSIDSPTIQQRKIVTTVAVNGGETVLLGGLIRAKNSAAKSGIPILSDLPIVGPLFGTASRDFNRTELLVLITPRVVRNQREARNLTQEIRAKFRTVLELERQGRKEPRRLR